MEQQPFKKSDPKAPKIKLPKFDVYKQRVTANHDYAKMKKEREHTFFTKMRKQYPNLRKYTNRQIKNYIKRFNREAIGGEVCNNRYGVQLPANLPCIFMGSIAITKKGRQNVNYKASAEAGYIIKDLYTKTNGLKFYVFCTFHANRIKIENCNFWGFVAENAIVQMCKSAFEQNYNYYIRVTYKSHISSHLRKTYRAPVDARKRNIMDEFVFDNDE